MLIDRTYRTWVQDYPQYYSGVNVNGGGHIKPSKKCPNSIDSLITGISSSGDFITDSFITVNINSTMGNNTNYIMLYDGNLNGLSYDASRPIYGNIADVSTNVVSNGFILLPINGTQYYVRRYLGPANSICSSNMKCSTAQDSSGKFIASGFAVVDAAGSLKFIQVFTRQ